MRFLFVSDFHPKGASGAAGTLLSLADALRRADHEVELLWYLREPYRLPHPVLQRAFELPRRQLRQVAAHLSHSPADVVIASQPFAYPVYERLAPQHPTTLFLNRTHGWEERVYQAQRTHRWNEGGPIRRALSFFSERLVRRACRRTARSAHGIIAACTRCARYIRERHDLDETHVAAIPYGLEEGLRDLRDRSADAPGQRMLYVGNYLPLKGVRVLERVLPTIARRYPKASVTFVSDPESVLKVERMFRPSFGARLALSPWVERETLVSIYERHDILLFPSLFEGFGKVWMEAMAAGLLVVGSAEGGLPDIATHDREALLCDPGNADAFLALLVQALVDPARSRAMGRTAQQMIQSYTWDRTARETVEFCRRLRESGMGDRES